MKGFFIIGRGSGKLPEPKEQLPDSIHVHLIQKRKYRNVESLREAIRAIKAQMLIESDESVRMTLAETGLILNNLLLFKR